MSAPALAGPGPGSSFEQVILPGNEDAARDLVAPVLDRDLGELEWRGPGIDVGVIEFWLMRDDQVRANLVLSPRDTGRPDAATSESFAIEVVWPLGVTPSEHERELMAEAVASVQDRDRGGFYVTRGARSGSRSGVAPLDAVSPLEPAAARRRWRRKVGAVMLIGLAALGVTLVRRAEPDDEPGADAG